MQPFVYEPLPARVIFGTGTLARLGDEVERLGLTRVLVLATPAQRGEAERLAASLGGRAAEVFAGAVMHTPVEVTKRAMAGIAALGADGIVSVVGGSTIGLGKAIALRSDLPQIVVPTTYAGSEMMPILGETRDGLKTTLPGTAPSISGRSCRLPTRFPMTGRSVRCWRRRDAIPPGRPMSIS
jgi:maleylacetate reductase